MIYIYQDYVHSNVALYNRICRFFGENSVHFCDADDIINDCLTQYNVQMLIMPGGADLYYCEKLNGEGNAKIKSYVENGGTYFGICAGAYYACSHIKWEASEGKSSICQSRELGFLNGIASGPVYEFIEDGDFNKSWQAARAINFNNQYTALAHYHGGPVFKVIDSRNTKILANYSDLSGNPAAIVECVVGNGKAILCSPHLEHDASALQAKLYKHSNPSYEWEKSVIDQIEANQSNINKIWEALLERAITTNQEEQSYAA